MSRDNTRTKRRRRFVEYARVSKVGDRGDDILSPELQVESMDVYAERNNIEVIDRVIDLDESGRSFEKRAVDQIVERIRGGDADGILLWKWSRWGRNTLQSKIYIAKVEDAGGEVRAATEDFDPMTTLGKFTRDQLLSIAEMQSNTISDGWRDVQRRRVEKLKLTAGGPPPFGYLRPEYPDDAGRHEKPLEPNPALAPKVIEMYTRYVNGHGAQKIARWLNAEGVTTVPRQLRSRGETEARGRAWSAVSVQRYLDSGFASGRMNVHNPRCNTEHETDDGERLKHRCDDGGTPGHKHTVRCCTNRIDVAGLHAPIIDAQLWHEYENRRKDQRRQKIRRMRRPWYLGAGLTVCDRCGGHLVVDSFDSPKSSAICTHYRNGQDCKGVRIARWLIEWMVDDWLADHLQAWADAQDRVAEVEDERARIVKELNDAESEELELADGLKELLDLVRRRVITADAYEEELRKSETDRRRLTYRATELRAQLDALDPDADVLDRLERNMITEPEELNTVMKRLLRRVVVSPDEVTVEPYHGTTWVYDRAEIPRRERSTPPKRGAGGRFVAS
jgi:site-specific DNA recombinase